MGLTWRSKEEFEKGAFYMLLSGVTLSLFTLFAKFGTESTPYLLLIFLRFVLPLLFLMPILLTTISFKDLFLKTNLKMQLLRSGCILIYQYSIFYYLISASVLDATIMQNTAPLFMPILELVFFKHRFEKRTLLSILVSFAGVLCILKPSASFFEQLSILGLVIPLSQAGSQVLYSHQAKSENQKFNLFYLYFIGSVVSGIVFAFSEAFSMVSAPFENYTLLLWGNLICLALATLFNQIFRGFSYKYGKASALAPFLYMSIIFSAIIDWAVFHHPPGWLSLAGAILVIGGGMIQVFNRK
jgi:drug/metabolite transporter (DMT)-like permease